MSIINAFAIFVLFVSAILLYKQYAYTGHLAEFAQDPYKTMKKYLSMTPDDLGHAPRPILWIYVPYDYNARNWESWGSRSSFQLNQPYLYLTVKSIIAKCDRSFTICMIDDTSIPKLLPNWRVNMDALSAPISGHMRTLAIARLVHTYGGMVCPISFLCMRDLAPMYAEGTAGGSMFVCENVSRNINSTHREFAPDITFFGAEKGNPKLGEFCEYVTRISGQDFTAQSDFLGNFSRWCKIEAEKGAGVRIIPAESIGRKTATEGAPILIDNLLGRNYIDLDVRKVYGIYIPADEILMRRNYEWFARCSVEQVVASDTILGNYLLLAEVPAGRQDEPMFLEPMTGGSGGRKKATPRPPWIGFWRTPLVSLYGQKPNFLGDNLLKYGTWVD
jgi:hypothetical protein